MHRGTQIFQKTRSNVKIPGARNAKRSKFDTDDRQLLGNTVQNSVARADWHLRFVQACVYTQYKGPFCLLPSGLTKYSMQELHKNMTAICPFIFRLPKNLFMSEGVKINIYKKKKKKRFSTQGIFVCEPNGNGPFGSITITTTKNP